MPDSQRNLSLLTVPLLLGLLAGGAYLRLGSGGEGEDALAAAFPDPAAGMAGDLFSTDAPNPVSGAVAVRDTLWVTVTAAGRAEGIRRAVFTAQVGGVVTAVRVRESARVGEGDLLVQLDTTEYALALAAARSNLISAEASFQEIILFDDQLPPEERAARERLARARSGVVQREVELRRAELDLRRTGVRAPFPGHVADLKVVAGEHVAPGQELMTVVDLDPVKVEASVLEGEVGHIRQGRRATVHFAAFPGESFQGRVETMNPVLDADRTARVTIHLPNPGGRIKPGMYARVTLEAQGHPDRLLVPRAAILERDRRTMLFVYEEGRARWRYVTTGLENETQVEIVEDAPTDRVAPGEVVLVNGHHYLAHELPVRLVEEPSVPGVGPTGS